METIPFTIKKFTRDTCWRGCEEKGSIPSTLLVGMYIWYSHYGEHYESSLKKLKIELPYDPEIPHLGMYLAKNHNTKRHRQCDGPCGSTYNIQDLEAI